MECDIQTQVYLHRQADMKQRGIFLFSDPNKGGTVSDLDPFREEFLT